MSEANESGPTKKTELEKYRDGEPFHCERFARIYSDIGGAQECCERVLVGRALLIGQ